MSTRADRRSTRIGRNISTHAHAHAHRHGKRHDFQVAPSKAVHSEMKTRVSS